MALHPPSRAETRRSCLLCCRPSSRQSRRWRKKKRRHPFSSDQQKAESLVSQLSGGGFPAFLSPVEVGGKTMYRVRLGPYVERSAAETAADRVRREYKLDTWITQ
jgi:hypothetical protein